MSAPVAWLADAWAGHRQWRILETDFGDGLNFLACWHAWKLDARRPGLLHFVSCQRLSRDAQDFLRRVTDPALQPLAAELSTQWFGLTPGMHRFAFEDGRVLLTLFVGQLRDALRQQTFRADCVFLDWPAPDRNPAMLKAIARHCRRGARLLASTVDERLHRAGIEAGFVGLDGSSADGALPQVVFDPAWEPRGARPREDIEPGDCVVIGAGLAGSAAAASLARRGWRVTVLDAADTPAAGASGLPVGLLAPHYSPDDSLLSRLSRSGVRMTMQQARRLLRDGQDWSATGTLEVRAADDARAIHADMDMRTWSREADQAHQASAGIDASMGAVWHEQAAWIRPAALVRAWLAGAGIGWRGGSSVHHLDRVQGRWRASAADGSALADADLVVIAAAFGSVDLLGDRAPVHPVRGQVTWGMQGSETLPPFPVHGDGHFIPAVPIGGSLAWFCGSTFAPGESSLEVRADDERFNLQRLGRLLPNAARALTPAAGKTIGAWTGVRCACADRRPLLGEIERGLWISTAMGSRGLTFAALCGELLAARVHGEPLPLERRLAVALDATR